MSETFDGRTQDEDVRRMGARTALEERTYTSEVRPAGITRTVSAGGERRDRVRWGPIWAGLVVALAVNVLLQLALVALGALGVGDEGGGLPEGALLSALAALIAFFVGGLVAGASSMWRDGDDGLFHGIVLWALAVVAVLLLSVLGGGLALGAASDVADELGIGQVGEDDADVDLESEEASDRAESAAGATLLGLALTLAAAAAGGAIGAKMWPSRRDQRRGEDVDLTEAPRAGLSR